MKTPPFFSLDNTFRTVYWVFVQTSRFPKPLVEWTIQH
jgi:hypothetical protein